MGTTLRIGMAMLSTTGGSSVVATNLGRELRARGARVRFVHSGYAQTPLDGGKALSIEHAAYLERALDVDRAFCGGLDVCSQVLDWYEREPFDVLHVHNVQVFGLAALLLKRLRGVPFVVTFHGSDVLNGRMMARNSAVIGEVLSHASGVTCVSNFLARALRSAHPALEPKVIFNFLGREFGGARQERGSTGPRVIHVSSLRGVKRPQLMMRAFAAFQKESAAATLRIVTTSLGMSRGAELLESCELGEAVKLIDGEARPEQLHREYRAAGALLLTSQYESFGLVMLEAMAYGVITVAPAVGGIPEVLGLEWPFLVREHDDPLAYSEQLARATDPSAGPASEAAMASVLERFQPEPAVGRYLELYGEASRKGA